MQLVKESDQKRATIRGLIPNIFAVCRFMQQQIYFSYGYDALLLTKCKDARRRNGNNS